MINFKELLISSVQAIILLVLSLIYHSCFNNTFDNFILKLILLFSIMYIITVIGVNMRIFLNNTIILTLSHNFYFYINYNDINIALLHKKSMPLRAKNVSIQFKFYNFYIYKNI